METPCAVGGVEGSCLSLRVSRKHMEQICQLARPRSATSHSHTHTRPNFRAFTSLHPLLSLLLLFSPLLSPIFLSTDDFTYQPPVPHRWTIELLKLNKQLTDMRMLHSVHTELLQPHYNTSYFPCICMTRLYYPVSDKPLSASQYAISPCYIWSETKYTMREKSSYYLSSILMK